MKILLTGASGFLGGWIARLMNPMPGDLRILARASSDLSQLKGLSYEVQYGDLLEPDTLAAAMDGVTQVIHAAGWINFKQKHAKVVYRANYQGTKNVFEAAFAAGVDRIVYTGSIFSFGATDDPSQPLDESASFNLHDLQDILYLKAKKDIEDLAGTMVEHGLPLIRIYPGLCLGPDDVNRSSSGAIDAWLRGQLPAIVTGGGICLMDVRDAALAHLAALEHGEIGGRYLATGHNITLPDLFRRLSIIAQRPAPRLHLPRWMGVPLAGLAESLNIFPALDHAQARLMTRTWWYDSSKAERDLGLSFRPLDETLADAVNWLRNHSEMS